MKIEIKAMSHVYGIESPWEISRMTTNHTAKEVEIHVICTDASVLRCSKCDQVCPVYDRRPRRWRHLDTGEYRTFVVTEIARVQCSDHGVRTVLVPWASAKARVTFAYESLVIAWLKETSVSAVARLMGVSWNTIDGIKQRAVQRGLARRAEQSSTHICVDETSFRKRHDCVTIVSDPKTGRGCSNISWLKERDVRFQDNDLQVHGNVRACKPRLSVVGCWGSA